MTLYSLKKWLLFGFFAVVMVGNISFSYAEAQKKDIYTIYDINVDETARSAKEAQAKALILGRYMAINTLFSKIVKASEIFKIPQLNDSQIEDLTTGYSVANEKRSNVRYIADFTFYFNQDKIRDIFSLLEISSAELYAPPQMIVPIFKSNDRSIVWDDEDLWRKTWLDYDYRNLIISFNAVSNIESNRVIFSEESLNSNEEILDFNIEKPLSLNIGKDKGTLYDGFAKVFYDTNATAQDFYIVRAEKTSLEATGQVNLKVFLHHYKAENYNIKNDSTDLNAIIFEKEYILSPTDIEEQELEQLTAEKIEEILTVKILKEAHKNIIDTFVVNWKEQTAVDFTKYTNLAITIPVNGSKTWFSVQEKLRNSSFVRTVKLKTLTLTNADVSLSHVGNIDQFILDLKNNGLKLERELDAEQLDAYERVIAEYQMQSSNIAPSPAFDTTAEIILPQKPFGRGAWIVTLIDG